MTMTTTEAPPVPAQAAPPETPAAPSRPEVRPAEFAAEVTTALIAGWDAIRARHPEVPEAVISMATGGRESVGKLAHFAARQWKAREGGALHHEVFVTAESLARGAQEVLGSLLHEAAHALNEVRGREDCSVSQYHNKLFKAAALELGLALEEQVPETRKKKYGFAFTVVPAETAAAYAEQIAALEEAIRATRNQIVVRLRGGGRGGGAGTDERENEDAGPEDGDGAVTVVEKEDRNYIRAVCACDPPSVIRVAPTTLKKRPVMCSLCTTTFAQDDGEG